jgi:hypothetical protein
MAHQHVPKLWKEWRSTGVPMCNTAILIASGLAGSVKSDFDWLRFNRRGFGVSEL